MSNGNEHRAQMLRDLYAAYIDRRKDIAIWGHIEARLMSPALMILGALNEDIWPEPADPGPWLRSPWLP